MERIEGRQNLNVEYLKNVVLSFFEAEERDPLIPVITQILHLSPVEAEKLRQQVSTLGNPTLKNSALLGLGMFGL